MSEKQDYWRVAVLSAVEALSGYKIGEPRRVVTASKIASYFGDHNIHVTKENIDRVLSTLSLTHFEKKSTPYALPRYVRSGDFSGELFSIDRFFDEMATESGVTLLWENYREFGVDWILESIEAIGEIENAFEASTSEGVEQQDEWAPLEIDYDSELAESSISDLEIAVDAIQNDNGYAATFPEERNNVVHSLRNAIDYMRIRGAYTRVYFRHSVIDPLTKAISRLGGNAAGKLAKAALKGLQKWITEFVFNLLGGP